MNFNMYNQDGRSFPRSPDAGFTRKTALAQNCGCNSGPCVSYEAVNWPNYYIKAREDGTLGIEAFSEAATYRQQASFCERP